MRAARYFAPACIRRAFFFLLLAAAIGPVTAHAQRGYRPPPGYVQLGKPDQDKGRLILEDFRALGSMGIAGDYYLEFELRVLPRRGDERSYLGRLWGSGNNQGALARVTLAAGATAPRLLIQNGPQSAVWQWSGKPGDPVGRLDVSALFTPLAQTDLTPFDLQMPFLYWTDFIYEGLAKIHSRPAYQFLLYPPADFAAKYPALTGVRLYLDTQYKQPVQIDQIGDGGRRLKTLTVQGLKKIGEQWIPKRIDLLNETTRDTTQFNVTGAALSQSFPAGLFAPAALTDEARPPAPERVMPIPP